MCRCQWNEIYGRIEDVQRDSDVGRMKVIYRVENFHIHKLEFSWQAFRMFLHPFCRQIPDPHATETTEMAINYFGALQLTIKQH